MNPTLLIQGLSLAKSLRSALGTKAKAPQRTVYDELRESSSNISDLRRYLEVLESDEKLAVGEEEAAARREARAATGPVTRAAHVRLNNRKNRLAAAAPAFALPDLDEAKKSVNKSLKPWKKKAAKQSKRVEKAAAKARRNAEKKLQSKQAKQARKRVTRAAKDADKRFGPAALRAKRRQKQAASAGKKVGLSAGIIALLAAIGGAIYWFFLRPQDTPATRPPRVEEHSGEKESTLVYSSKSEDDLVAEPQVKVAGDLAEDPAERDEELLGSIDEQLAAHRENEEALAEAAEGAETASQQLDEETKKAEEIFKRYRDDQTK